MYTSLSLYIYIYIYICIYIYTHRERGGIAGREMHAATRNASMSGSSSLHGKAFDGLTYVA